MLAYWKRIWRGFEYKDDDIFVEFYESTLGKLRKDMLATDKVEWRLTRWITGLGCFLSEERLCRLALYSPDYEEWKVTSLKCMNISYGVLWEMWCWGKRSVMILLNSSAGVRGRITYICFYFLCFHGRYSTENSSYSIQMQAFGDFLNLYLIASLTRVQEIYIDIFNGIYKVFKSPGMMSYLFIVK